MNDPEWMDLRWSGALPVVVDDAMEDWLAQVRGRCPWDEMPLDDVAGEFRAVLEALLEPGIEYSEAGRAVVLRRAARAHGEFRRRQGFHAVILAEEVSVAEDAIGAALVQGGASRMLVARLQESLRPVMRAIVRGMYRGYD